MESLLVDVRKQASDGLESTQDHFGYENTFSNKVQIWKKGILRLKPKMNRRGREIE